MKTNTNTNTFIRGQRVIANGHPGIVLGMYGETMVEIRLERGDICISSYDVVLA